MTGASRCLCAVIVGAIVLGTVPAWCDLDAKTEFAKAPTGRLIPGETAEYRVIVTNTGHEQWPKNTTVLKVHAVKDPEGNALVNDTSWDDEVEVGGLEPGSATTMNLKGEAGAIRGEWVLQASVEVGGRAIGDSCSVTVEVDAGLQAQFSSWKIPRKAKPGVDDEWQLTVRNPGPAFWESGLVALRCTVAKTIDGDSAVGKASFEKQYSLKSLAGGVDELFGVDETARLNVKVKTPEAPGIWQLEWQMYDEEKAAVFGRKLASTIEVTYNVGSGASEAKISPEKSSLTLKPGQKAAVGLDVENTGDTSWPENTHVVIRAISDPGGRTARGTTFDAEVKVGALNPGEGRSLSGSTAPEIEGATWRGDWKLEALVEADGKEVRGAATFEVTIEGSYDGKFGSPRVPKSLKPKEKDDWQFTVTNKGDLRWDEDTVCLKSVLRRTISGKDKDGEKAFEKTWTDETNGEAVDEGDSHKFTVGIVAPPTPGQWTIRWYLYDVQKKKDFGSYVETTIEVK